MAVKLTELAHKLASDFFGEVRPRCAVDATLGNGRDALFLARLVGDGGTVFGFDVQRAAVENSRGLLARLAPRADFRPFLAGHEDMEKFLPASAVGKIGCVFFNLGWLPNSDKSVSTKPETTLAALGASLRVIDSSRGYLSAACYRGHSGGAEECAAVLEFFKKNFGENFSRYEASENPVSPVLLAAGFSENNSQKKCLKNKRER